MKINKLWAVKIVFTLFFLPFLQFKIFGSTSNNTLSDTSRVSCPPFSLIQIPAATVDLCLGQVVTYSVHIVPGSGTYTVDQNVYSTNANSIIYTAPSTTITIGVTPNYVSSTFTLTAYDYYQIRTRATNSCGIVSTTTLFIGPLTNPTITAMTSNSLICSGQSASLTAVSANTIMPINYVWTPTTGLNGVVSPTATTIYSVTATNAFGCSASKTVTVNVSPCTHDNEYELMEVYGIYPNPHNGRFKMQVKNGSNVKIYNSIGDLIVNRSVENEEDDIDISEYPNGMYIVCLELNNKRVYVRTIKD